MLGLAGESEDFKSDTLSHWEPVQRTQHRSDVLKCAQLNAYKLSDSVLDEFSGPYTHPGPHPTMPTQKAI